MDRPRNEGPQGNIEVVDKTKLDLMTKEMLESFLQGKTRADSLVALGKYTQDAEKVLNKETFIKLRKRQNDLLMIVASTSMLFDGVNPKPLSKPNQRVLLDILGIKGMDVDFSAAKKLQEEKETQDFMSNHRIEDYASEWARICLKDPHQIAGGKEGKIAQVLAGAFGKETTSSLEEELKRLESMKQLPNDYKLVIKTLMNITNSEEFRNYSGGVDKLKSRITGHSGEFNNFQNNFKTFVLLSAKQKKEFTKEDFNKHFDEKRELSQDELKNIVDYGNKIFNEITSSSSILVDVDRYITQEESKLNQDTLTDRALIRRKITVLNTIKSIIQDDRVKSQLHAFISDVGNILGNKKTTQEAFLKNAYNAIQLSARDGKLVNIKVDRGEYVTESLDITIQKINSNIGDTNAELIKKYLASIGDDYGRLERELGRNTIAAMGSYLNKNPTTQLFQGTKESMKGFFLETYAQLVHHQATVLGEKRELLSGKFDALFPSLMKYQEIVNNPEIQKRIQENKLPLVYDTLAGKISNGRMAEIMKALEIDANNLESEGKKKLMIESEKWKGKTIKDANIVTVGEDTKSLEKISKKILSTGSLTQEDVAFLLRVVPPEHPLRTFVELYNQVNFGGSIKAQALMAGKLAQKGKPTNISTKLNKGRKEALSQASRLGGESALKNLNQGLYTKNADPKNAEQKKQYMEARTQNDKIIATSMAALAKNTELSKEDQRDIARTVIDPTASDKQIDKWIDTQVFLSKYVEEKNFVDMVEKNAAYMDLGETKTIGELHGINKVDISNMSSDSGSVRLSETSIMGHNSFAGMSELMGCRVEVGESGVLCRTIRTPEGQVIAENIPLENIPTTIEQLGRFYTIGLGPLVPKMKEVNNYISKVRPDAIGGTDGTYGISEDEKFLKIMATMIYGEENLPREKNVPNLIKTFNRPGRENEPSFILRQKGVLTETGGINTIKLGEHLQSASSKV